MADKEFNKGDFDPKAAAEARKKEMEEITEKLEKGVKDVFAGEDYEKLMKVMAKMPHYSINNQILIMLQKPDAQICNSFSGWKNHNRHVKAGEKGLRILAPAPYQMEKEQDKVDAEGKAILDKDGEPVKETVKITVNAFKPVSTFDISQTEGEPLPSIGVDELVGTVDGYEILLEAIKESSPVPVAFENIESGAKGYFNSAENRIAVQEGMSEVQTIKTLLHEVAHAKYHNTEATKESGAKSREQKETEAESIAYVCCAHYGIDSEPYSAAYIAGWSSDKEASELKASLQTIREGASEIIDRIDWKIKTKFAERNEEQSKDGFVEFDPAIFEGSPFADVPFAKAEVDQPSGFIKIEPPLDVKDIEPDKQIEVTFVSDVKESEKTDAASKDEDTKDKTTDPKSKDDKAPESKEKKQSVKEKLEKSKEKAAKAPKTTKSKTSDKKLQEAI